MQTSEEIYFDEIKQYNDNLRDYQVEMKQRIFSTWQQGNKSIMMQMPTGTGKTMLFVSIICDIWLHHYNNKKPLKKFLILVHRKELVEQVQKTLYYKYGLAHGTIQGGKTDDELYHIQVAMVHTLAREKRLKKWKDNEFDFIICDEAHHFLANDYLKIREAFPDAYFLGVTATPYRLNHQPFTDFFDILLTAKSINEFIKDGWLSEYEYYSIEPTSKLQLEIDNLRVLNTGDYSDNAMSKALDNRKIRAGVVKTWLKYAKGKKTIVYTINQEHNNHLCSEFNDTGYKCVAIDSNTPKEVREEYVEQFRKGEITIICNVNIFSEGFDCPDIECIQLARPTKSLSMYLQQVGRGLRIAENKEKTIFLDNVGLYNRFRLPSANRFWQMHFKGRGDEEMEKRDYPEDVKRIRMIETEEEADDDFEMIYSNVENKDGRVVSKVAEKMNLSVDEVLNFFANNNISLTPNDVLTRKQMRMLANYKREMTLHDTEKTDDGFVSIFDIPNEQANGKKNFYCKVKNYKTNEWEIVFYKNMVSCYVDIVNRFLDKTKPFTCIDGDEEEILDFSVVGESEIINKLVISDNPNMLRTPASLKDNSYIEKNVSNIDKFRRLKFLLEKACEFYESNEDVFFNFGNYIPKIETEEIQEEVEEQSTENTIEINNTDKNIITINDMQYNINEMTEKEIIELMLMLHDKVSIEFLDEKKAEERLQQIEKENELQELDKKIEESELGEDEILRMAARIQQRKQEKENKEQKELEDIAKRNIAMQSSAEEKRRKNALNSLKEKFDEHNA